MSEVTIEVVEDAEHPLGGHAVIRLNGLWLLPANATFRIEPLDDATPDMLPADWPGGDRSPVATRLTPQGVEIVIGPDIVDAAPLLPGTPVAVSVPAAFVRAEVLWPDLPVSAPIAAAPVVLTAIELAAELDAVALANREREETEARLLLQRQMIGAGNGHAAHDAAVEYGEARGLSELRSRPSSAAAADTPIDLTPDMLNASSDVPRASRDAAMAAFVTQSGSGGAAATPRASKSAAQSNTGTALQPAAVRSRALVPVVPSVLPALQRRLGMGAPFALGFVVAALLTGLFAWRQAGTSTARGDATTARGDATSPVASLADLLAVAVVSPRGRSAAGVDLPNALKLADESLHATVGGTDHAEASFWLRKSLALSVGTQQLSWTLTQLGALYAQPAAGAPDYGKARLLWEMAGASGDATALCFLGALHEHGLGVPRNTRQALGHYQRAKSQGGCADVDDAIARVRN